MVADVFDSTAKVGEGMGIRGCTAMLKKVKENNDRNNH